MAINNLQSPIQMLTNQFTNNPYVGQWATPQSGGGGNAYTVNGLSTWTPPSPVSVPSVPTGAPPPQNSGALQNPFSPTQQNFLNNMNNGSGGGAGAPINASGNWAWTREHGGPPMVLSPYGQPLYTNAPGSGAPHPFGMMSPEQLYAQSVFHKLGINTPYNSNPQNPYMGNAQNPNANPQNPNAVNNDLHVTYTPQPNPMMHMPMGQPASTNPGNRTPSSPSPMPSHFMGFSHLGNGGNVGGGGNR